MPRLPLIVVAASLGALFAACDLNPQPLPPGDDGDGTNTPATGPGGETGKGASSGFEGDDPTTPSNASDAATIDGGHDGGDAGTDADAGPT